MDSRRMYTIRRQRGFSLLELLLAIIVFSIGLLGIAGMQMISKRANFESLQRTTASHVAYGLLEDMRTNGSGLGVYLASPDLGGGKIVAEPAPNCRNPGTPCTAAQKANHDLWFWETMLDGQLELGAEGASGGVLFPTLCINGPAGGGAGIYVVSVAWRGGVELTNPVIDACGAGTGQYGDGNEYRRVMQVPTFIDPSV